MFCVLLCATFFKEFEFILCFHVHFFSSVRERLSCCVLISVFQEHRENILLLDDYYRISLGESKVFSEDMKSLNYARFCTVMNTDL